MTEPSSVSELISMVQEIQHKGYIESQRSGDTGIGKTLEELLDIKENNLQEPDTNGVEIKSARKNSSSPLTLFTKEPPKERRPVWNENLLEKYGYTDDKGRRALKTTIKYEEPNPQGLLIEEVDQFILIRHESGEVCARYPKTLINNTLASKFKSVLYMIADVDTLNGSEAFWFSEGYFLTNPDISNVIELLKEQMLHVDLRMHKEDGENVRNRGTAWRLTQKDTLTELFLTSQTVKSISTDENIELTIEQETQKQAQITDYF